MSKFASLLLPWLLGLAAAITGMTNAPEGGFHGDRDYYYNEVLPGKGDNNVQEWKPEYKKGHSTCREGNVYTEKSGSFTHFLVIRQNGDIQELPFDEVLKRNKDDNQANDVWVVGVCDER